MKDNFSLPVDIKTVAAFFDVTVRAVQHWAASGCPKLGRGRFDLKAVHQWWWLNIGADRAASGADSDEMRTVKLAYWKAKSEGEQIKNKQTLGELIPKSEIIPEWAARMAEVANGLESFGVRIAALIVGKDAREVRRIVHEEQRKLRDNYCRKGRFCLPPDEKG